MGSPKNCMAWKFLSLIVTGFALLSSAFSGVPDQFKLRQFSVDKCSTALMSQRDVISAPEENVDSISCVRKCSGQPSCGLAVTQTYHEGHSSCTLLTPQGQGSSTLDVSRSQTCEAVVVDQCPKGMRMGCGACVCPNGFEEGTYKEYQKQDGCISQSNEVVFQGSQIYDGRFYLFGMFQIPHAHMAVDVCAWYGGYLAEIDDEGEFNFLEAFQKKKLGRVQVYWLAASDEAQEGKWVFPRTGKAAGYLKWGYGQPDDSNNEDCQSFTMGKSGLNDVPCKAKIKAGYVFSFICEIPLNK